MAALFAAIHVFLSQNLKNMKDVDARHKAGHDGVAQFAMQFAT